MTATAIKHYNNFPPGLYEKDTSIHSTESLTAGEILFEDYADIRTNVFQITGMEICVRVAGSAPDWFEKFLINAFNLMNLKPNWNSYGSKTINFSTVKLTLEHFSSLISSSTPEPHIGPTSDGGIQIEWHQSGIDLELEYYPSGIISVLFEANDDATEWEQGQNESAMRLRECIDKVH